MERAVLQGTGGVLGSRRAGLGGVAAELRVRLVQVEHESACEDDSKPVEVCMYKLERNMQERIQTKRCKGMFMDRWNGTCTYAPMQFVIEIGICGAEVV